MALAKSLKLDIYGSIRVVTWIRRQVAAKRSELEDDALIEHLKAPFKDGARPAFLEDDDLLFPYLPDDPLLSALVTSPSRFVNVLAIFFGAVACVPSNADLLAVLRG
eukprot:1101911-Rhodomonas_salina.2